MKPTFYSQHGEDYLVWRMADARPGYYVEVGALDGKRFSNTYALEQLGWHGVCVKAHPQYYEYTRRNRPNAAVVHAACCDTDQRSITFQTNGRGTLSAITPLDESFIQERFADYYSGFKAVQVEAKTLTTILDDAHAPRHIDFVSIDVEGNEMGVMRGIDFDRYDIRCIVVEANCDNDQALYTAYLTARGYIAARRVAMNLVFCKDRADARRLAKQAIDVPLIHTAHPHDQDAEDVVVPAQRLPVWTRVHRLLAG
jgi:FkbM family methyltransferase